VTETWIWKADWICLENELRGYCLRDKKKVCLYSSSTCSSDMIRRERSLKSCAWPSYIERSHSVIQSKPAPPKIPSMHFAELVPQMMSKNSLFFLSSPPSWRGSHHLTICKEGKPCALTESPCCVMGWRTGTVLRQTRRLCPIMWFGCKSLVCMMDSLVIQIHAWLLAQGTRDL